MSKTNLLKGLVVIALSVILVVSLTSLVFADDNSFDSWDSAVTDDNMAGNTSNTENIFVDTSNNVPTNTQTNTSTNTGSATTSLNTNDNTDENEENEVNSLAYTGIEDTNVLPILVVLSVIVAAYSFKKIKEYNV